MKTRQPIRVPFEVYHPSVFIREEMEARSWDRDDLTTAMVGLADHREWGITRLALDFFFDCAPSDPRLKMGDMAEKFAHAFGVSVELFTNLDTTWRRSFSILASPDELAAAREAREVPRLTATSGPGVGVDVALEAKPKGKRK